MFRLRLLQLSFAINFLIYSTVFAATEHVEDQPNTAIHDVVVASSNNFPPLNLLASYNQLQGFGKDFSDAVFRNLGVTTQRIHSSSWTQVWGWLMSGRADVIHDTGYAEERDEFLEFSQSILSMDEVIFVRNEQTDIHIFHNRRLNRANIKLESALQELKTVQNALGTVEQHLKAVMDNSPDVIYIKDITWTLPAKKKP